MPSLFSKLKGSSSKKNNPYLDPCHPVLSPTNKATTANTTTSNFTGLSNAQLPISPQEASLRGSTDLLAEARIAVGRDPVTGRKIEPQRPARPVYQAGPSTNTQTKQILDMIQKRELPPYEQEYLAAMQEQERIRKAGGSTEYYAPERQVSEYYAGPVRD